MGVSPGPMDHLYNAGCGRVIHGRVLARRELSPTGTMGIVD
jgi:hypothetical protein